MSIAWTWPSMNRQLMMLAWNGTIRDPALAPNPSQWLKTDATDLSTLPPFQLYDLAADPDEKNNLASAHPEVVLRLGRLLRRTIESGRSTPVEPQPPDSSTDWPQSAWMKEFP